MKRDRKQRYERKQKSKKRQATRATLQKMAEYDRGVDLCPAKQVFLNRKNLSPCVVIYDLETAGFRREQDILQVRNKLLFVTVRLENFLICTYKFRSLPVFLFVILFA